jgi:hypothetical protein
MKLTKNQKVMIPGYSVQKAILMADHTKGKNTGNGQTSRYFKHTSPGMIHFDYQTVKLFDKPMTRKQLEAELSDIIRSYNGYGSKGGKDYAPTQASRTYSAMFKEGLIVVI